MKTNRIQKWLFLSLALILLLAPLPAQAWGPVGHQTVAYIAEAHLTDRTKAAIHSLLPANESLVSVCSWADEIRPLRPETATWHYLDLPVRDDISINNLADHRGTNDILFHIQACISKLKEGTATPSNRVECLKFLVHFAGDLCMPLHCADDGDRGGNDKIVRFYGRSGWRPWGTPVKLHALWDHLISPTPTGNSLTLAKSIMTQITPAQIAEWTRGGPSEWVLDTYGVAKQTAYAGLPAGPTAPGVSIKLPRRYFSIMQPTVKIQLAKAGIRLATLLNTLFDPTVKTP